MSERRGDPPGRRIEDLWREEMSERLADTTKQVVGLVTAIQGLQITLQNLEKSNEEHYSSMKMEIEEMDAFLRGDLGEKKKSVEGRLDEAETRLNRVDGLLDGATWPPGENGVVKNIESIKNDLRELKGNATSRLTRRGQNLVFAGTFLAVFVSIVGLFKDRLVPPKKESPEEYAARLVREVQALELERGPIVRQRLQELEKAGRKYR